MKVRFLGMSAPAASGLLGATVLAASVVVACTTEDPRAGTRASTGYGGTGGSAGGTSSSGGIDIAAAPTSPIDCGPAPGAPAPFTKQALLSAAAECASWHACGFQNAATTLRTTLQTQSTSPTAETLAAARAAWKTAMNEWSKMELFQFGPVGSRTVDAKHGRGLRSYVHPWPAQSRCEVEKQVATKEWQTRGVNAVLPGGRGLFAIEYALFYPGADTACLAATPTGQAFASFRPDDLATAKYTYATAVGDNLVSLALELRNIWRPEGENFKPKLLAFDGYGSEQETLNVVAWSLYYPGDEVKDFKVAALAGLQSRTPTPEAPFAGVDIENIRSNLQAFRSLFQGCSADGTGVGFDDWLIAAGQPQLAQDIIASTQRAQAAADAFPSFSTATQAQFGELYNAIKPLSDILKTSFFGSASALNLKLPATAASDTD